MKVLFMGTPEFAVPSLKRLAASDGIEVAGVVTQPDRAKKHGKSEPGAVKLAAEALGIPIIQPEKIKNEISAVKAFGADVGVTAAYGQILTQAVLDAFPLGVVNVHASLLPKYRGASPITAAIANGDKKTGVTIMRTALGVDTGDILSAAEVKIGADETADDLTARLAQTGADLLVDTLARLDKITPVKQDDALASHCKTIKKGEEFIDFDRGADEVKNFVRSLCSSPCAKTVIDGQTYKIFAVDTVADIGAAAVPGEILQGEGRLIIACKSGAVEVKRIQAPSKRALDIAEFLRGKKFATGSICGKPQ